MTASAVEDFRRENFSAHYEARTEHDVMTHCLVQIKTCCLKLRTGNGQLWRKNVGYDWDYASKGITKVKG